MPLPRAFRLGPYEIIDWLSAGSMGEIYRARDTRLGREIAVKVLPRQFAADKERLARFEQEARAAGVLNHPNIVSVYDIGVQDGTWFVVSELIDGFTLRTALGNGPVPRARAIDWVAQIAEGLSAAHARGVVHRDLKPENVMLTPDGRVKIVDFGIAKLQAPTLLDAAEATIDTTNQTAPGAILGTVAYMSPEQLRGEPVDHRADIFSLGVLLYELVAGRHPFARAVAAETMTAILRDDPPASPRIDAALEPIVRRALEKPRDARFQSAGDFARALESVSDGAAPYERRSITGTSVPRTIAVLPFANMSAESGSDYFSDGLTEELIQALTKVRGLQVVAWHSASQLRGDEGETRAMLGRMNVRNALAGSVRRAGDRVRIAVRLVEVASGFYLWSETYDRRLEDVFAIQQEIAEAIVARLTTALMPEARGDTRPHDVEAYHLYLRGRFFCNKRTPEGLRRGIACFEQALAIDGRFALAHSGLSDAHCLLADYGVVAPAEAMPRARAAAQRALELDPRSAEAHASLGYIRSLYDWEWLEGEALYRRAIELSPGYATAHHWLALDLLAILGRGKEAEEEMATALHLDPLSLIIQEGAAYLLTLSRRYDEAVAAYRALVDFEPSFYKAYTSMGRALSLKGDYDVAIAMLEKGRELGGDQPSIVAALGQTHALAGNYSEAKRLLATLEQMSRERHVSANTFALVHAGLGEHDLAMSWLENGCEQHELPIVAIKVHPAYDALRDHPRFAALLGRMHLDVVPSLAD